MNAGYKGSVHNHPGYVSAPYNPFKSTSWQDRLHGLELKFRSWLKFGNVSRTEGLKDVNQIMQEYYPGKYTVTGEYDLQNQLVAFKLVFDDPKEETVWLLMWS